MTKPELLKAIQKGVRVKVLRWYAGWRLEIAPTTAKPTFVGWVLNLRRQVLLLLPRLAVAGLQKLDGRADFEAALARLLPEQMTAPGAMGEWSVKDILGHISMWESRLVTLLYAIERGATPPQAIHTQAEVDKVNAESYAEQRNRPIERILADFHGVHKQLLKRLEAVKERDLNDPKRFKWMKGEPLEKLVAGDTFAHYAEHRPAIET